MHTIGKNHNNNQYIKFKKFSVILYCFLLLITISFNIYLVIRLFDAENNSSIIGTFSSEDGIYAVFEDNNYYMIYNPEKSTVIAQGIYHLNDENIGYMEKQEIKSKFIFNGKDKVYTKLDSHIQVYKKVDSIPTYINIKR